MSTLIKTGRFAGAQLSGEGRYLEASLQAQVENLLQENEALKVHILCSLEAAWPGTRLEIQSKSCILFSKAFWIISG